MQSTWSNFMIPLLTNIFNIGIQACCFVLAGERMSISNAVSSALYHWQLEQWLAYRYLHTVQPWNLKCVHSFHTITTKCKKEWIFNCSRMLWIVCSPDSWVCFPKPFHSFSCYDVPDKTRHFIFIQLQHRSNLAVIGLVVQVLFLPQEK